MCETVKGIGLLPLPHSVKRSALINREEEGKQKKKKNLRRRGESHGESDW